MAGETPDCVTYEEYSRMIAERDAERAAREAAETSLTEAFDEIFVYVPDANDEQGKELSIAQKIRILIGLYDKAETQAEAAEQSAREMAGDAERYRWLRDAQIYSAPHGSLVELWLFNRPTASGQAIDQAIDESLAAAAGDDV